MLDFFVHPKTRRTDWWTVALFLVTLLSLAGAILSLAWRAS
jgi:hypothetical protein